MSNPLPPTPVHFDMIDRALSGWEMAAPKPAPFVLFLHGFLDTGRSYDAVFERLAGKCHCLAMDWRGHGASRPLPKGASAHLLDHLKDLSALVDTLAEQGRPPDLVVAHSMGGNVALLLAGTRPDRVPRLLLLDALGAPPEDADEQVSRIQRLLEDKRPKPPFKTVETLEAGIDRMRRSAPHLSDAGARLMARHNLEPNPDGGFRFAFDAAVRGPTPTRWPEPFWHQLCSNVLAPTWMVRAENGFILDDTLARDRLAKITGSRWVALDGVGHHLHVDAPDAVSKLTLELLEIPVSSSASGQSSIE